MTQWLEVDNWLDLLANAWIGLVLIAVAAVPSWFAHRNGKDIAEVRNQVQNAHRTNLRDDLDRALAAIEELAHDMRALRTELSMEGDRRRVQIQDLAHDVDRMRRR